MLKLISSYKKFTKLIAIALAVMSYSTQADTQTQLFLAEPSGEMSSSSAFIQDIKDDANIISMLFSLDKKTNDRLGQFSLTLTDQEKLHSINLKFNKNEEGKFKVAIKANGEEYIVPVAFSGKRLQLKIEGLLENSLSIQMKGSHESETHNVKLTLPIKRLHLLHKSGELNIFYLITR